jgi:DNA-binding MarR family transcriptional regulator
VLRARQGTPLAAEMSVLDGMKALMCEDAGWASGWDVITSVRRSQHRMEVFMNQSLEPLGISFAQYRALEAIVVNREIHLSELARLLRLTRQAVQISAHQLDAGGLVDLVREPGRVYVRVSAMGIRRLELFREFTNDLKAGIERELSGSERHHITTLLDRASATLDPPRHPEWWLSP